MSADDGSVASDAEEFIGRRTHSAKAPRKAERYGDSNHRYYTDDDDDDDEGEEDEFAVGVNDNKAHAQKARQKEGGGGGGRRCQRSAANARERARMRVLSRGFSRLRTSLPWVPVDTKLSKLDTLRLASSYISHLGLLLQDERFERSVKRGLQAGHLCCLCPAVICLRAGFVTVASVRTGLVEH
ncbi:hypothetical protein NHX12_021324 [Muraenolepis orangiensis]|uniref:BHLH domain-containing protein n=1 Tax=Muraenolepis orangiensis TaxID=630683 RepID=A0A9Q0IVG3_9TELE|nr:hypothetical protein NHX12_021324 [Muraenolepis orangiensis]